ncbi:MAG TPA: ABC transporter ATP-binding protein [Chitinophagaceae bacterium]|nr:ABC transporter ATP-binding protein [Chitinophagaceae bacterium]
MKIWLSDAGKRFNRDWIFRHLSYTFHAGNSYAITGPNGSGKSTLLQLLSGALAPSQGKIEWSLQEQAVDADQVFQQVSICAPYLELIEEMSALEFLNFHGRFKNFMQGISTERMLAIIGLQEAAHKQIRYYSSGMKQRVKLAQAIFSDTPVLLLDEPCTNLDEAGYELYYQLINEYCTGRLVVISSNDEKEFGFCKEKIKITEFK